jgi:DNA-binding CsgD family transcriptional regulator
LRVAHFSQCVRVSRIAKDQPYALQLSAFPPDRQFGQGADQACAIVFVNDPEQPPCVDNQTLRQLFGLTDAECRVAIALCTGETLAEIAQSLGVRESTIKTHLLKVFEKTNTHRRVHLVKLLLALSSHNKV